MHTHYPILMKHLIACKALNGSLHSTWSWDTGRSRWMRKVSHWLCSQWGQWASASAKDAFQTHQHPCYFPEADGDLSWGPHSPLVHHLLRWCSHLLQGSSQPPEEARGCALETGGGWTQAQAFQMWAILMADCLPGACDLCPRSSHWLGQNWSHQKVDNPNKHQRGLKFSGIHGILPSVYP